MPGRKSSARGQKTNRRKSAPSKGNRRAPRTNTHFTAATILTVVLKQAHKREEIYPLLLSQLVSRDDVGPDADIRMVGYTMSVALATGNDCSTVSMNLGHEGPWIRRTDSTDTFNQVCTEHTVRGKSILFKKKLLATSEREYLNPDGQQGGTNTIDLRVRDPCGVIPGVAAKIEFRAHLIRRVASTKYANADQPATDRYEDQSVNAGSNPSPSPPAAVKHVPAIMVDNGHRYYTDGVLHNGKFTYTKDKHGSFDLTITVDPTVPQQVVSGIYDLPSSTADQADFNSHGYDGLLTVHS